MYDTDYSDRSKKAARSHKSAVSEAGGEQAGFQLRWRAVGKSKIVPLLHTYPDGEQVEHMWWDAKQGVVQGGGYMKEIANMNRDDNCISVWDDLLPQLYTALEGGAEWFEMVEHRDRRGPRGEVMLDDGGNPLRERPRAYRLPLRDFLTASPPSSCTYKPSEAGPGQKRYGVALVHFDVIDAKGKVIEKGQPLTKQGSMF